MLEPGSGSSMWLGRMEQGQATGQSSSYRPLNLMEYTVKGRLQVQQGVDMPVNRSKRKA